MTVSISVFGPSGTGKSSLCNYILGLKFFEENGKSESGLSGVVEGEVMIGGVILRVIDTPGLDDTRGREYDSEHLLQMVDFLTNNQKGVNCLALVVSAHQTRLSVSNRRLLDILFRLFKDSKSGKVWDHLCVIFTHCYKSVYVDRTNLESQYRKYILENIESFDGYKCCTPVLLPAFFVDSHPQEGDVNSQMEITRLLNFASGLDKLMATEITPPLSWILNNRMEKQIQQVEILNLRKTKPLLKPIVEKNDSVMKLQNLRKFVLNTASTAVCGGVAAVMGNLFGVAGACTGAIKGGLQFGSELFVEEICGENGDAAYQNFRGNGATPEKDGCMKCIHTTLR